MQGVILFTARGRAIGSNPDGYVVRELHQPSAGARSWRALESFVQLRDRLVSD